MKKIDLKNLKKYKDDLFVAKNDKEFMIFSIEKINHTYFMLKMAWAKNNKEICYEVMKGDRKHFFKDLRTDLTFYKLNKKEKEHYKNLLILSELE